MKPMIFAALALCAVQAQGQTMKARELFYAPPPAQTGQTKGTEATKKTTAPKAATKVERHTTADPVGQTGRTTIPVMNVSLSPLALRYSVLKRSGQGAFEETNADSTFHSGDRIRLSVQANDTGYLYVVMRGSSGAWRVLFPAADESGGDNKVVKGKSYTIPPGKNGQFFFDETGGEEKLFLVLTRKAEPDLEALVYSMADRDRSPEKRQLLLAENRPAINDSMVERLRSGLKSRDLVFEKVDEDAGDKKEKAVYVANPTGSSEARLVVDVSLKHNK